ncbi:nuclear transport factor 2 family protein [Nocardioides sambongensis]|uniref:nuclear transport factor 2 family protein n=1 Tax=Nocardioides sambongensis TaxID=2589074 RepID=UPI00112C2B70|nr:nuclear transport factor 2 family protein [Nocardioides sambongensis]
MSQVSRLHLTEHAIVGAVIAPGPGPDRATGRIACLAHHLRAPVEGTSADEIWHIVYRDRYVRAAQGWRIEHREMELRFRTTASALVADES